ncbi:hypothetical protein Cabther_B0508 [Chloracidobacterium thermophilum B]|uniref:Uncharacterized protein n=1 Tax=Chloracidobacterium thermophilum (strain B) TaxID=981222 RepID=G2LLU4_CHLTF|nr:hypothetical protein Cabther_B0508 [Chloracidobacterium thermophilum B]
MFDAGVLFVRELPSVLVGGVGGNARRNFLGNEFAHPIGISPRNVAELIVERLDDVGKPVEFWFRLVPTARSGYRFDLGSGIRPWS